MLKAAVGVGALVIFLPVLLVVLLLHPSGGPAGGLGGGPTDYAKNDIPPGYLSLYTAAAPACPGLPRPALGSARRRRQDRIRPRPRGRPGHQIR